MVAPAAESAATEGQSVGHADRFEWERVLQRVVLPPSTNHLAAILAQHADPDGTRVYPGTERLAKIMNVSTSTVKRGLAELRSYGFIERVRQGNRWANQSDLYRLTIPVDLFDMDLHVYGPDDLSGGHT
ncbi:helix-turn-helix domain-containing protein [Williamsia sp.]|uniref:helix-turn-helix domain-containing protein n=1 Tax=Williamsia sp. TaxID=1872085 RepID=UPI002F921C8D